MVCLVCLDLENMVPCMCATQFWASTSLFRLLIMVGSLECLLNLVLVRRRMSTRCCKHFIQSVNRPHLTHPPLVWEFGEALRMHPGTMFAYHSMRFCTELFTGFPRVLGIQSLYDPSALKEHFQILPAPSCFTKWEKELADCLKLGMIGDCLFICVYGDNPRQFDMWVMKEYGVQDSWTKTLEVENLYLRERSCGLYEPLTRIARTQSDFRAYAYSPSFVSLYFASKGKEVKRVGTAKKLLNKRLAERGSDCAGSSSPPNRTPVLAFPGHTRITCLWFTEI